MGAGCYGCNSKPNRKSKLEQYSMQIINCQNSQKQIDFPKQILVQLNQKGPTLETIPEKDNGERPQTIETSSSIKFSDFRSSNKLSMPQIQGKSLRDCPASNVDERKSSSNNLTKKTSSNLETIKEKEQDYLQSLEKALQTSDYIITGQAGASEDPIKEENQKKTKVNPYNYIRNKPVYKEAVNDQSSINESVFMPNQFKEDMIYSIDVKM